MGYCSGFPILFVGYLSFLYRASEWEPTKVMVSVLIIRNEVVPLCLEGREVLTLVLFKTPLKKIDRPKLPWSPTRPDWKGPKPACLHFFFERAEKDRGEIPRFPLKGLLQRGYSYRYRYA